MRLIIDTAYPPGTSRADQLSKVVEEFREVIEEPIKDRRIIELMDLIVVAYGMIEKEVESIDSEQEDRLLELYVEQFNQKMSKRDHIDSDVIEVVR